MPISLKSPDTPLLILTPSLTFRKNNCFVYSVMVQVCLVFSLLALCFFACFQQFFTSHLFSSSFHSEIAKLDSLKLDLNDSSLGELAQIPGVGKSIASEIVNYRKVFGGFKTLDEIEKLKGVGKKTAEKIRHHLVVSQFSPITDLPKPKTWISPNTFPEKASSTGKINLLSEKLDPNLASFEELKKLPGIGDLLAKRIVDKRQDMMFRDENDLQKVSGIGKKTSAKIAPFLKFPLISQ